MSSLTVSGKSNAVQDHHNVEFVEFWEKLMSKDVDAFAACTPILWWPTTRQHAIIPASAATPRGRLVVVLISCETTELFLLPVSVFVSYTNKMDKEESNTCISVTQAQPIKRHNFAWG